MKADDPDLYGALEASLDPESPEDAEALRRAAHRLLDAAFDQLLDVRRRGRPWRPIERRARAYFASPLPERPESPEQLADVLLSMGLLDPPGHAHPSFFGWAIGAGTLEGSLGALVAALTNVNAFGGAQVATLVEAQVLSWTAEALALPRHARGVLLSGTSEANLVALAAARHQALGPRGGPGAVLASVAAHHSVRRASRLLGLGDPIPLAVDEADQIRPEGVDAALDELARAGVTPVALVATAGTPAAGAFDPLPALAERARARGVWLHVDGAFGAWARSVPELSARVAGLEAADSLALDYHKALHAPYAAGALLVREPARLTAALAVPSDYLVPFRGGLGGLRDWPGERSLATSRGFSALGIFTTFAGHGMARLRSAILGSYRRAFALAERVDAAPRLTRVLPVTGPVVLLRPIPSSERTILRLVTQLQQDGRAVLTPVRRSDGWALRASTLNHRTRLSDLEALIDALSRLIDP